MKKALSFFLALLLLSGCVPGWAAEKVYKIGCCVDFSEQDFNPEFYQALAACFPSMNGEQIELLPLDAAGSAESQEAQIQFLISQGVDALILYPTSLNRLQESIQAAVDADVPLVIVYREPLLYDIKNKAVDETDARITSHEKVCFVGADPRLGGDGQAQLISRFSNQGDINGDGVMTYVMLGGASEAELIHAQHCGQMLNKTVENAQCLETVSDIIGRQGAVQTCARLLRKYNVDLDLILCASDEIAMGAAQAIRESQLTLNRDVYLVGLGGVQEALRLLREGGMTATIVQDFSALARQAAEAALKLARGEAVQHFYLTDYQALDQQTAQAL